MLYQGVYWEKGLMEGCYFMFPLKPNTSSFCIGSEEIDGPDLLIRTRSYVYLCVGSGKSGDIHDYLVINDFDGPIKPAHSGDVFDFGSERFRLV